ncbi:MAG: GNAT family N-acetyltransferase [Candidatus Eisenbacteria bacterium]
MPPVKVRDMNQDDEYFVSTCTHINETDEIDACARTRLAWLKGMHAKGLRAKVAVMDGDHAGFIYVMPIEVSPWGPVGKDLLAITCLFVKEDLKGRGAGRALLKAAEDEARHQGKKALVVTGYYHDFWFMPAKYFDESGFTLVAAIAGDGNPISEGRLKDSDILKGEAILWKVLDPSAEAPDFLRRNCEFRRVQGKVVVDLFYNTFCQTSNIEARRVREVVCEFEDRVRLNEYPAEDSTALMSHQTPRGIFVDGKEISWGYEAPRDGIREAVSEALRRGADKA